MEAKNLREVPQLPTRCGYVHSWDYENGVPNRVENYPSRAFHGAYYWVRPKGLTCFSAGISVWSPEEARYGVAVWWNVIRDKPAIQGFVLALRLTDQEEIMPQQLETKMR